MGTVTIKRKLEQVNKLRKINIYLDGAYAFSLSNGASKDIKLDTGTHNLLAKIDWCSSAVLPLTIKENEKTEIILYSGYQFKSSIFSILYPVVFFGGLSLNLYFKSTVFFWSIMVISAILLFIVSYKAKFKGIWYYLTLGRKEYLKLEEVSL